MAIIGIVNFGQVKCKASKHVGYLQQVGDRKVFTELIVFREQCWETIISINI